MFGPPPIYPGRLAVLIEMAAASCPDTMFNQYVHPPNYPAGHMGFVQNQVGSTQANTCYTLYAGTKREDPRPKGQAHKDWPSGLNILS